MNTFFFGGGGGMGVTSKLYNFWGLFLNSTQGVLGVICDEIYSNINHK